MMSGTKLKPKPMRYNSIEREINPKIYDNGGINKTILTIIKETRAALFNALLLKKPILNKDFCDLILNA